MWELGLTDCEWPYWIRNYYHDPREVSIAVNQSIFAITFNGTAQTSIVLDALVGVRVCVKIDAALAPQVPQMIPVLSEIKTVVPDPAVNPENIGNIVVIHSTDITVFIVPEPVIVDNQGIRSLRLGNAAEIGACGVP